MDRDRIGTLRFEGEDARNFMNSFFFPTESEIAERNERRRKLHKEIDLKKTANGYEAEIAGLDLSFLDEDVQEEQIVISVQMSIKAQDNTFYGCGDTSGSSKVVFSHVNKEFKLCTVDEIINWAA